LRTFPSNQDVYLAGQVDTEPIQGDAWRGFSVFEFNSESLHRAVVGIVLSNSCDLAAANRTDPAFVTFAPVLRLDRILSFFREAGNSDDQIKSKSESIRKQQISSMFYLPPGAKCRSA
jgi:hypothetical protein